MQRSGNSVGQNPAEPVVTTRLCSPRRVTHCPTNRGALSGI